MGILKDYILRYELDLEAFSYEIKSNFKKGNFLYISCNTFFRYNQYTHINLVSNRYILCDGNNKYIQQVYLSHKNTGDDKINHFSMNNNDFYMKLLNDYYEILKIKLLVSKGNIHKNTTIAFRLFNYNSVNNIII